MTRPYSPTAYRRRRAAGLRCARCEPAETRKAREHMRRLRAERETIAGAIRREVGRVMGLQ